MSATCRKFRNLIDNEVDWHRRCVRDNIDASSYSTYKDCYYTSVRVANLIRKNPLSHRHVIGAAVGEFSIVYGMWSAREYDIFIGRDHYYTVRIVLHKKEENSLYETRLPADFSLLPGSLQVDDKKVCTFTGKYGLKEEKRIDIYLCIGFFSLDQNLGVGSFYHW